MAKMLCPDPAARLSGLEAVRSHAPAPFRSQPALRNEKLAAHKWFEDVDWDKLRARQLDAPIKPDVTQANCDTGALDIQEAFGEEDNRPVEHISAEDQAKFAKYRFNVAIGGRVKHALSLSQGAYGSAEPDEDELYDMTLRETESRYSLTVRASAQDINALNAHWRNFSAASSTSVMTVVTLRSGSDPPTPVKLDQGSSDIPERLQPQQLANAPAKERSEGSAPEKSETSEPVADLEEVDLQSPV
jgi:hypothetical protein